MNWEEYANTVYGGQNSDVIKLLELYFTSGAYVSGDKEKRQ